MLIGIDLDDVAYPFVDCLAGWLRDQGRVVDPAAWITYDGFEAWGMSREEFTEACTQAADAGHLFTSQPPLRGFTTMMRALHAAGHELHIVTARAFGTDPATCQQATRDWLAHHRIPHDSLTFSADKRVVPVEVFLDDNLGNYDALEAAGHRPFLMDRPHNQDPTCTRRRVRTHRQFTAAVTAMATTATGRAA